MEEEKLGWTEACVETCGHGEQGTVRRSMERGDTCWMGKEEHSSRESRLQFFVGRSWINFTFHSFLRSLYF